MKTINLDSLYYEKKDAEWLEDKIEELETEQITTHITGMPKGYGISNKTQNTAVMLADLRTQLTSQYESCLSRILELNEYIGKIEDAEVRTIFRLRFIECRSYSDIARIRCYADHTVVWKKINNYLKGKPSKQKQNTSREV